MDLVVAVGTDGADIVEVVDGSAGARTHLELSALSSWVAEREREDRPTPVRWVWPSSAVVYARLVHDGVRVRRAVDLSLVQAVLRRAAAATHTSYAQADPTRGSLMTVGGVHGAHGAGPASGHDPWSTDASTLFEVTAAGPDVDACLAEHLAQQDCLRQVQDGGRLALLCHAESVGGLIAQELNVVGVPFDAATHEALLTQLLGRRSAHGGRPAVLEALSAQVRDALGAPTLNPDSQADLVAQLRRAGLDVGSTRQWELQQLEHPAVEPLLSYKKLSRLHTANGWAWMQAWVRDGRFRPDWVAGAVVTGRWASRGGGALQLPRQIRGAVLADPGWRLVVADAAQLEPRVLAAMAGDEQMARAAGRGDLYQALVDQGVVDTRAHAKVAMLGAMYGATTGEAGALMPRLHRAYPRAIGMVEEAARTGERGGQVRTWLGRTSPEPSAWWHEAQSAAQQPGAGSVAERRARQAARDWGRFTRNFVVQGTAAEWALCWMGHLRRLLDDTFGQAPGERPELVYFLHDEVIVHTPERYADEVADAVCEAGRAAGSLLFGTFPVTFPLDLAVVRSYDEAG